MLLKFLNAFSSLIVYVHDSCSCMYNVFSQYPHIAHATHYTSKYVESHECCGDGGSKLMKTLSEDRVASGVQSITLKLALLGSNSGFHGTKASGCGGGLISLTYSLSLCLCFVSRKLLAVHT